MNYLGYSANFSKGVVMDIYRKMTVWDLMNFLKSKVKNNVDLINSGIIEIKTMQGVTGQTVQSKPEIDKLNSQISQLTSENNQLLHVFNELLKTHNIYLTDLTKQVGAPSDDYSSEMTEEYINRCTEKTVSGELSITAEHPLLASEQLAEHLLQRCMLEEQYENCALILKYRVMKHTSS